MNEPMIVVLVHGWSVRNINTYGELAARLKSEANKSNGIPVDIRNIWLSKYISFHDEVRLEDLARAFESAIKRELGTELNNNKRFACITHSTGGPVIRDWWDRIYLSVNKKCPMSHLIMLAPANFGSALAQLGKSRLSRIKTWFQGVEPGQGVLGWLELGSPEAWALNKRWITGGVNPLQISDPVYPFVLMGQTIDRKIYDHLNAYTGEIGSDGVVRVAAANMNSTYIKLVQNRNGSKLMIDTNVTAWPCAFALIRKRSHSGEDMGILRSIKDDNKPHPTVSAVLACLRVDTADKYIRQRELFDRNNDKIYNSELVEKQKKFLSTRYFIHDKRAMLIVRVRDHFKYPINDFDFLLLGRRNDPNYLPEGFFVDRQRNSRDRSTLTYFMNASMMRGSDEIKHPKNESEIMRPEFAGMRSLGIRINPRPGSGFVYYQEAELSAAKKVLEDFIKPHQTTLLDIKLYRVVTKGTFELANSDKVRPGEEDFTDQEPGVPIDN